MKSSESEWHVRHVSISRCRKQRNSYAVKSEPDERLLRLTNVAGRVGTFLQPVTVPDGAFAGIGGHLKILS